MMAKKRKELQRAARRILKALLPKEQFDPQAGQYMVRPDWLSVGELLKATGMEIGPKGLRRAR